MAAAAVTFDGTRVNDADAVGTVWTGIGGGGAKAVAEPDFVYQGSFSISSKVGTSLRGQQLNLGAATDYTTPLVWIAKCIATNSSSLLAKAAPGGVLSIGTGGAGNSDDYYVAGNDDYPLLGGWLIIPIDPNGGNASAVNGGLTLSSIDFYSWTCDFSATSKSENVASDAVDNITSGTGLTCLDGIGGTDGNFALFATTDEDSAGTNRWGIVSTRNGILFVTGVLTVGDSGTGAEFTSSGEVVVWPDAEFLNSVGFFGLDINLENASTVISISNSTFISRGTTGGTVDTRAIVEFIGTTATAQADITGCNFQNLADFIATSKVDIASCNIETAAFTQGSANVEGCVVTTVSLTSIATLQDPTFGTTTDLNNTEFIQGGAGHAVEIATAGNYTFTEMTWTGYGADTTDSAALDLTAATGTYNLTIDGGTTPTFKKLGGATVNILNNVTLTLTGMREDTEVRVYNAGTTTEVAGIETVTGGTLDDRSFAFSLAALLSIDINIFNVDYDPVYFRAFPMPSAAASIPISQRIDRSFNNPQ
tara:strand:+ start:39859 stop:41466 length:1608 start_codon:yes stop_codon:yes gene_type:complete